MSIFATSLAAAMCAIPAPQVTLRADDAGLVAGAPALARPDWSELVAQVDRVQGKARTLAMLRLARALFDAGYDEAGQLVPFASAEIDPPLAALLDNDRAVMDLAGGGTGVLEAGSRLTGAAGTPRGAVATAVTGFNLSLTLASESRYAEAEKQQRAALATLGRVWPAEDARLAAIKLTLARTLIATGQAPEAEAIVREAAASLRQSSCGVSEAMADALGLLAQFAGFRGDAAAAEARLREAIAVGEQLIAASRAQPRPEAAAFAKIAAQWAGDSLEAGAIERDEFARFGKVIASDAGATARRTMRAQGRREAALSRLLLAQRRDSDAAAAAEAALRLAPAETEAQFAVAMVRLREGKRDPATLTEVAQALDASAFAGGEVRAEVIGGRAQLARWLAASDPYQAWVQARQAQAGIAQRLMTEGATAEDAQRLARQFQDARRATIAAAWAASSAARPAWLDGRSFTIYFDIDRTNINPSAARVLDAAVEAWRRTGGTVEIEGHLDRRGTPNYDVGLSDRMASAARAYLEARGVPAGAITTIAFGQSRPLIDTPAGVAERRNRRAVIRLLPPPA